LARKEGELVSRSRRWIVTCITSIVLVLAVVPAAFADGDPASDYLLSGASFLSPYDGRIPAATQATINSMLASAQKQGLPLKLAVIATSYDLGSVPVLFGKPQIYAKFLGLEDYYYWRDELIVVMPKGYGIYKSKSLPAADKAVIKHLAPPASASGPALAAAAEKALIAVAAKHGITLSTSGGSSGGSSAWTERGEIAGGAAVLCVIGFGVWYFLRRRSA
jgi:hypothetical protein